MRPNGDLFAKTLTPGHILRAMKLNVEATDECSCLADAALQTFHSHEDLMYKAYVATRAYSRAALNCRAWRQEWKSVADGVQKLLREIKEPAMLFTTAFNPAKRIHHTVRASKNARKAVLEQFAHCEMSPVQWRVRSGRSWQYKTREEILEQLLVLPDLGPLGRKNLFQLLRRHDPEALSSPAAGRRRGTQMDEFAITSVGARFALNWLLKEPGGRHFCAFAASMASFPKLVRVKKDLERHVRVLARKLPDADLDDCAQDLLNNDGTNFTFDLCESWKVLEFARSENAKYLREHPEGDDDH